MKVILTEKPSVAKSIADVIGAKKRENGYFEGNGFQVTWAYGHLVALATPEEVVGGSVSLNSLPILPEEIPLKVKDEKSIKEQFKIIKNLFNSSSEIICATDAGREGELIFRLIYEHANCTKPFKRLWISSVNPDVIKKGMANLLDGKEKDSLYIGGKLRQIADWYLGFNTSIAMTKSNGFLIKIGRVKTPTLFLLVRRFLENKRFVSTDFFTPSIHIQSDGKNITAKSEERFEDKSTAQAIMQILAKASQAELTNIEEKSQNTSAPALFNLAELQKAANNSFGYTADETLSHLQQLYESGYVTYPRTDSRYLNEEMESQVFSLIEKAGSYFNVQDATIPLVIQKNKKPFDNSKVTDHHAIIPESKFPMLTELDDKKRNIYLTILTSFFKAFADKQVKNITTYTFSVNDIAFPFLAKGTVVVSKGFTVFDEFLKGHVKNVKNYTENEEQKDNDEVLPILKEGFYPLAGTQLLEGKTTAPPLLTDASLIAQMETCGKDLDDEELKDALKGKGIGTSATRGGIIKELVDGDYILRKGKSLLPTRLGFEIIKTLNGSKILSPTLTGEWENAINKIELSQGDKHQFLKDIKVYTSEITQQLLTAPKLDYNPNATNEKCPKCNSQILQNKYNYFCSQKDTCDFKLYKLFRNATITEKRLNELFTKNRISKLKLKTKEGKAYTVNVILNKQNYTLEVEKKEPKII